MRGVCRGVGKEEADAAKRVVERLRRRGANNKGIKVFHNPPARGLRERIGQVAGFTGGLVGRVVAGQRPRRDAVKALITARRILVVELYGIGDMIMSLPLLAALRQHCPNAKITVLCRPTPAAILEKANMVDRIIRFEPHWALRAKGFWSSLLAVVRDTPRWIAMIRTLRSVPWDVALSFYPNERFWALMALSGAPFRIAPVTTLREFCARSGWRGLLTHPVYARPLQHYIEHKADVLRALGLTVNPYLFPELAKPDEIKVAREKLKLLSGNSDGPFVLVHPGAGHPIRYWPASRFAAVIDHLISSGRVPIVIGGAQDTHRVEEVLRYTKRAPLVMRTSLEELPAIIAAADLFIGHDTGTMHLASVVGTPLVAIFGPDRAAQTGPRGKAKAIVLEPPVNIPCRGTLCVRCHRSVRCVEEVSLEAVVRAVDRLLFSN